MQMFAIKVLNYLIPAIERQDIDVAPLKKANVPVIFVVGKYQLFVLITYKGMQNHLFYKHAIIISL